MVYRDFISNLGLNFEFVCTKFYSIYKNKFISCLAVGANYTLLQCRFYFVKSDFTNFLHFSFGFENPIYIIDPFRSSSKRKIDLNSASHELLNCWITILLSLAFVGWLTAISTIDCVATCHKSWDKNFVCRFSQLLIFMVFAVYAIPQRRIMEFEASSSQLRAKKISQQKNCRDKMILFINTYAIPPCFPGKKSLFVLAIIHAWNKNFISCSCHVI